MSFEAPSSSDNVVDSRKILSHIEELESDVEALHEAWQADADNEAAESYTLENYIGDNPEDDSDVAELKELRSVIEQLNGETDGVTLIRDTYFETYAEELANDLYSIEDHWPFNHIDWKEAAEALLMDYTSIEWAGETFYVRS